MNITYGICVGENSPYLDTLVDSIHMMYKMYNMIQYHGTKPKYEIIKAEGPDWLPAKKNRIADQAQYPNLCIVHDYYKFSPFWFESTLYFDQTNFWDIAACRVFTNEGKRSADWMIDPFVIDDAIVLYPQLQDILLNCAPHENGARFVNALPYHVNDLTKFQYISGGYILCKTDVLRNTRFNESMLPGSPEDVEWSERVLATGAILKFNPTGNMHIQKPNKWAVTEMPMEAVEILRKLYYV